jgi:hypothetical protein
LLIFTKESRTYTSLVAAGLDGLGAHGSCSGKRSFGVHEQEGVLVWLSLGGDCKVLAEHVED